MGANAPFSTAPRLATVGNAFSSDQQRGYAKLITGQRCALLREPVNPITLHSTLAGRSRLWLRYPNSLEMPGHRRRVTSSMVLSGDPCLSRIMSCPCVGEYSSHKRQRPCCHMLRTRSPMSRRTCPASARTDVAVAATGHVVHSNNSRRAAGMNRVREAYTCRSPRPL